MWYNTVRIPPPVSTLIRGFKDTLVLAPNHPRTVSEANRNSLCRHGLVSLVKGLNRSAQSCLLQPLSFKCSLCHSQLLLLLFLLLITSLLLFLWAADVSARSFTDCCFPSSSSRGPSEPSIALLPSSRTSNLGATSNIEPRCNQGTRSDQPVLLKQAAATDLSIVHSPPFTSLTHPSPSVEAF
jgi:hypothetical protein